MISIRPGDTITRQLPPVTTTAGQLINADAIPTASLVVNGIDSGVSVTVVNVSTGLYRMTFTAPSGGSEWAAGSSVQVRLSLSVAGSPINGTLNIGQAALPVSLASGSITDATLGWSGSDTPGVPSTVLGRLRRFISEYFQPRSRNRTTGEETSFAADGTTPLHKRTVATATNTGVTTDTVTTSAP